MWTKESKAQAKLSNVQVRVVGEANGDQRVVVQEVLSLSKTSKKMNR